MPHSCQTFCGVEYVGNVWNRSTNWGTEIPNTQLFGTAEFVDIKPVVVPN